MMTISKLKGIISTMEQLGCRDAQIWLSQGRDGKEQLSPVDFECRRLDEQDCNDAILVVKIAEE